MKTHELIAEIIAERKRLGVTQNMLAQRAQISRRSVVDLEGGKHDIGLRKLIRILDSLGMSIQLKTGPNRPTEAELAELFKEEDE